PADTVARIFEGQPVGTLFEPVGTSRDARTGWIAHALKPQGALQVDAGAKAAIVERHTSLLPSGIVRITGSFSQGAPVDVVDESGVAFARGLAAYPAHELRRIAGKRTAEIESVLGYRGLDEAIHRDDLVLLGEA
ncbi:MAG: glutamate 5-kinase, partial [Archangium sp.]|nr:glutamate 5-kinase [Archangium sp.]